MTWTDHIHVDPGLLGGKLVIKGTRLAVDFVLGLLAEGWSQDQLQSNYPQLTDNELRAVIVYAAETLPAADWQVHPLVMPLPATCRLRRAGRTFWILPNAFASLARAWYRSHRCCMFIQKSGVIAKNFARRKAVLGVIPRRPLTSSFTWRTHERQMCASLGGSALS